VIFFARQQQHSHEQKITMILNARNICVLKKRSNQSKKIIQQRTFENSLFWLTRALTTPIRKINVRCLFVEVRMQTDTIFVA
jgi:hypothetical protein